MLTELSSNNWENELFENDIKAKKKTKSKIIFFIVFFYTSIDEGFLIIVCCLVKSFSKLLSNPPLHFLSNFSFLTLSASMGFLLLPIDDR